MADIDVLKIKSLITYNQLNHQSIAAQLGMARETFSRKLSSPGDFRVEEFLKLASILGVESLDVLFTK
ncbi:MAG: hypothetical protein K0M69_15930 [Youngiibacter sp.]|nr:hypothetical protein [Youngiibacter sp.]